MNVLAKSLCKTNMIGFWWDIKTSNIEYYDIQYSAEWTIGPKDCFFKKILAKLFVTQNLQC